ncbi:MAG TPA: FAD-dependent oxidoreductase, partial [Polyangiaceae bacterium]|nr:FAD-dependent oxidoreductase [Polyangiaceae bacterium]
LFTRVGCLNLGPSEHPAIRGVLESAERYRLPHAVLDEAGVRGRFSVLPSPGDLGVFEEDAGFLAVEACTEAHLAWASSSGAVLHRGRVTAVDLSRGAVRATLDDGSSLHADRVVVAAGAWLAADPAFRPLAPHLPLVVERQVQLWFHPAEGDAARVRAPALPAFIHFVDGGPFYGVPLDEAHPAPAVKVCRHHGGESAAPDSLDRSLRPEDEATVRAYLRVHLPAAAGPVARSRVCMYTNTHDDHFVVGPLARAPQVVVLGGFSGHGYKMASVMGEIAADLTLGGRSAFDLGMFAPDRFGRA